ncbi:MAG: rRNA adenine dimethyltransferase family protein [Candidatus Absconditabacterales bacterium]
MGTYLGQNFLIDSKIRSYIADKISVLYRECECKALIEIGPGKGAITKLIQDISDHFFVIEKDVNLIQNLEFRIQNENKIQNLELIKGDVLEVDVERILEEKKLSPKKTLVVGNLPYYITSPILRKFFGNGEQKYAGGIFMVQDEVGQKLRSDAKKKSYLRRLLNYAYDVTYLKGVPAKCFKPVPKVKSALIELKIKNGTLKIERDKLIEFLELFAPFSRKTLGAIQTMLNKRFAIKALPRSRDRDKMIKFSIPENLQKKRLEELDWENIVTILVS